MEPPAPILYSEGMDDVCPPFAPQLVGAARPPALGLALRAVEGRVRSACQPLLDASGLTYAELLLLEALWEADGATPDALAHRGGVPLGVVGLQLDRLAELGLVEHEGDAAWLTPQGFALRRRAGDALDRPAVNRALETLHVELAD